MTRPRFLRLLRIAVSAACGIVCLALIALWVRSYWVRDTLLVRVQSRIYHIESFSNVLFAASNPSMSSGWFYVRNVQKPERLRVELYPSRVKLAWGFSYAFIPNFIPIVIFALLSSSPWIIPIKRFSLRTLLIATTLVAVVLGLVVAMR